MSGAAGASLRDAVVEGMPLQSIIPAGAARGMVVIHEIFGRTPEIDRVVERFAAAGYAVAAPQLFKGGLGCIRAALVGAATGRGPAIDKVRAVRRWLSAQAGLDERRIGIIGFCFGGGFALAAGPGFGAVSTNYGDVPSTAVLRGIGPVIGCYGGRDRLFGRGGDKLRARLLPLGVTPEVHDYPAAGHSFLTDGHHPVASALSRFLLHLEATDPALREDAWKQILAFFERTL